MKNEYWAINKMSWEDGQANGEDSEDDDDDDEAEDDNDDESEEQFI